MVSVFLDCGEDERALAVTLASLVPGSVEGVIREVVVVDRGMGREARMVADQTGCERVEAPAFRRAIDAARSDWLLFLEPGARLGSDWIEVVAAHCNSARIGGGHAARFRRAKGDRPGFLRRVRQIRTALAEGFLVPKQQAVGLARLAADLEETAKGVAVKRLSATIRPA